MNRKERDCDICGINILHATPAPANAKRKKTRETAFNEGWLIATLLALQINFTYIKLIFYISLYYLEYTKSIFYIRNYNDYCYYLYRIATGFKLNRICIDRNLFYKEKETINVFQKKVSIMIISYFNILYNIIYCIMSFSYPAPIWRFHAYG